MKIISVNIEEQKHHTRIKKLFEKEKPDVVCLQEWCEEDVARIANELETDFVYVPMYKNINKKIIIALDYLPRR